MSEDREARRERWAEALYFGALPWESLDDVYREDYYREADAAMAVADAENNGLRATVEKQRNVIWEKNEEAARLREELRDRRFLFVSARDRADNLAAEIARLREELSEAHQMLDFNRARAVKTEAAIDRAWSVLDEWYGTSDAGALSSAVRAALDGEACGHDSNCASAEDA